MVFPFCEYVSMSVCICGTDRHQKVTVTRLCANVSGRCFCLFIFCQIKLTRNRKDISKQHKQRDRQSVRQTDGKAGGLLIEQFLPYLLSRHTLLVIALPQPDTQSETPFLLNLTDFTPAIILGCSVLFLSCLAQMPKDSCLMMIILLILAPAAARLTR